MTVAYEGSWYAGCVLSRDDLSSTAEIKFLEPAGPADSFKWPKRENLLTVAFVDILSTIDMTTKTGKSYSASKKEQNIASRVLKKYRSQFLIKNKS